MFYFRVKVDVFESAIDDQPIKTRTVRVYAESLSDAEAQAEQKVEELHPDYGLYLAQTPERLG